MLSIGNRLSSGICSPSCSSMYSRIISSVIVPELTAKYPRAQKGLSQNFFFKCGNSCSSTRELIPSAIATSDLHIDSVDRTVAGERDRAPPSRTRSPTRVLRRSAAVGRAHEELHPPSVLPSDISVSTLDGLLGRSSCARPTGNVARDHVTPTLLRLKARGFHHPRWGH